MFEIGNGIHNMGDLELFVKSGELLKLCFLSITYKKGARFSSLVMQ